MKDENLATGGPWAGDSSPRPGDRLPIIGQRLAANSDSAPPGANSNASHKPGGFIDDASTTPPPHHNAQPDYQLPGAEKIIHVKLGAGETTFKLPANATFDTIRIVGHDLVLVQKGGTAIVLDDTADKLPNITIGDVDVPKIALEAAFTNNGIEAAAGPEGAPTGSSGGDFSGPVGGIGDPFPLTPLQPPEGFGFTPPTFVLAIPQVSATTPPVGGASSSESVSESALAQGTAPNASALSASTTVAFTAGLDDLHVTLNSSALTTAIPGLTWTTSANGQEIEGYQNGVEVVKFDITAGSTSGAGGPGTVTVVETLLAPITGEGTGTPDLGTLNVVATDTVNPATVTDAVTVNVVDDHPVANADTASVADGSTVSVTAANGLFDPTGTNDKMGADQPSTGFLGEANVTGVVSNGTANVGVAGASGADGVPYTVVGQYGTLTLNQDGSFSYLAHHNVAAGSQDVFTYTITDADGTTASNSLTITINAGAPPVGGASSSEHVLESALAPNGSGTHVTPDAATTPAGALTFTAGADTLNLSLSTASLAQNITDPQTHSTLTWSVTNGGLTVIGAQDGHNVVEFDLSASSIAAGTSGSVTVTETLLAPISGEGTATNDLGTLTVVGTDAINPQTVTDTVAVGVVDDGPQFISADHGQIEDVAGITLTGNMSFIVGADQPGTLAFNGISTDPSHPTLVSGVQSLGSAVYEYVNASGEVIGTAGVGGTEVFTVSLNEASATYSFDLIQPFDFGHLTSIGSSTVTPAGPANWTELTDSSGNPLVAITGYHSTAGFDFATETPNTGAVAPGATPLADTTFDTVNASASGLGVHSNNFNQGDVIFAQFGTVDQNWAATGNNVANVNTATFQMNTGYAIGDQIQYIAHYTDGTTSGVQTVTDTAANNGAFTVSAGTHGDLAYVELYDLSGKGKFLMTGAFELSESGSATLPYGVTLTDQDGSTTTGAFDVTVTANPVTVSYNSTDPSVTALDGSYQQIADTSGSLGGSALTSATNAMIGGPENDIFIGQFGPDTMTGGGGSDIFKLETSLGLHVNDVITDFISGTSGTHDTVDLTALLSNL